MYIINIYMDCHNIWDRHSWLLEDEGYFLNKDFSRNSVKCMNLKTNSIML